MPDVEHNELWFTSNYTVIVGMYIILYYIWGVVKLYKYWYLYIIYLYYLIGTSKVSVDTFIIYLHRSLLIFLSLEGYVLY